MAAHSGGVDWASVVKPLSSANNGPLQKNDVLNIVKAILKSESEILDHDEQYELFYMYFCALAANSISGQCSSIWQSQIPQVIEATNILIRYILPKLQKATNGEIKLLLPALKSLCEGKSQDQDFDQIVFAFILKNAKFPETSKCSLTGGEKDSSKSEMKRSRSDLSTVILQQLTTPLGKATTCWTPLTEDLADYTQIFVKSNIALMESLNAGDIILKVCSSLPTLAKYYQRYEESALGGKPLYLPIQQPEANAIKNSLAQMSSDISILSMALTLPVLDNLSPTKITQLSQCAMSALYCAVLTSISCSILSMSGSSSSSTKVAQQSGNTSGNNSTPLSTISYVNSGQNPPPGGTSNDGGNPDDTADDDPARLIVDKALEIFRTVGRILSCARNHIYQNHVCMGAWLLISGIQGAMGASGNTSSSARQQTFMSDDSTTTPSTTTSKGKSPSRSVDATLAGRVNLFKVQQGFGVLNAAIASHSLSLLTELIEDLKVEARSDNELLNSDKIPEPAGFNIMIQYTSMQRIVRVLNSVTLQQLLTFLATVSYRKACTLKRVNIKNDGEPISYSDSTTYFNDTFSSSDESDESDDEEDSYLGLWFKETILPELKKPPPEPVPVVDKSNETKRGSTLVPVKDEPHEYLELSAQIFTFLDTALGSQHKFLNKYVRVGLSEQQMVLLANILKDLDRDSARNEPETMTSVQWQSAMVKFAGSLGRYLHNLISGLLISETLQSSLLQHLGVSPWTQDSNIWPLQVYSRTLSVLVQILLLKPYQEKEAACLSVWQRLVNTLVEGVCSISSGHSSTAATTGVTQTAGAAPATAEIEYEDLNVEHAQLLLFLFHSLNLMQKKSVLLLTAGGVIRCAEVCRSITPEKPLRDYQIMLLSRLLLFLEYMMKHLYNAPTVLLEQVRWNLFSTITLEPAYQPSTTATSQPQQSASSSSAVQQKTPSDIANSRIEMMSFCRKDLEHKYRKNSPNYHCIGVRPKFYSLTAIDTKIQQEFKLDGLAWNFILCTPDKLKYPLLVDALIDILAVTDICMAKVSYQTLCAVNYCFSLCWKLLLGLPPSTPHVEALMQDKIPNLHLLIWAIRCLRSIPTSNYLIVNSLVKQGMYTQYAETLWNKITDNVSDMKYSIRQTYLGLDSFNKTFQIQDPRFSKIILLDTLVSHLYALYWSQKDVSKSGDGSSVEYMTSPSPLDMTICETSDSEETSLNVDKTNDAKAAENQINIEKLSKELLIKLLDAIDIVKDFTYKTMTSSLSGPIPKILMESLISITGSKNQHCTNIATQVASLITGQDKEIIYAEWHKTLPIQSIDAIVSSTSHVELYTLSVIEGHITEIFQQTNFSILLSLKHSLTSMINLLYFLFPSCKLDAAVKERLQTLLIPMMLDMRAEYMYDSVSKCLETLLGGSLPQLDSYKYLSYLHILRNSYKLLIDFTEMSCPGRTVCLDETIVHNILKFWEQIIDKPMGLSALHTFFYEQKNGNLVQVLLSFANTTLSQLFATRVLQFFEKLFEASERTDSQFKLQDLCACISDLGQIENSKLKNWLSHILLGPGGINVISSADSSNVQTPTNMATVSAIPSISDQLIMQPSDLQLDPNAMDIDYDCSAIGAVGQTSSVWHAGTSITTNRSSSTTPNEECLEKNGRLLQTFTKYIVAENRQIPGVSGALFQALIQLGQNILCPSQDAIDFTDLLQVMITLADASHGKGHSSLFTSAIDWLDVSKNHVLDTPINDKQSQIALENVTSLLRYMVDLLHGLGYAGSRTICSPWEDDLPPDFDDCTDDIAGDDDDSGMDDSDEDSLGTKLCTYSITQKEFTNQHWYHCHTCKMIDGVGVCSVCARVCHKNHDISYAKYGNFFCDCGAKDDSSCQALSKRTAVTGGNSIVQDGSSILNAVLTSSSAAAAITAAAVAGPSSRAGESSGFVSALRWRHANNAPGSHSQHNNPYATTMMGSRSIERALHLAKIFEACNESLRSTEQWKSVVRCLLDFVEYMIPTIKENCAKYSTVGCHLRAKNALERLHQPEKSFTISDQIMLVTLGSQEGAFENVRSNYVGEQGQTIRQLIATNMVRRVGLCCLSSPHGKRQHLAVSHEKGKVTILQLSALLKQTDAAKKKLTLSRLASAPIPCTIMSLASNPANEDFLAVCGLKECHILTFSSNGAANEHIVITPQLETGNFIKRALWLPGSQTMLALITCDYVKIYDLAEDTLSPQYYFVVPSGKIRDCTFVYQSATYYLLLFASSGYIYTQPLIDESLAKHGAFYVTNTLDIDHPLIYESKGALGEGGASIYYSHILQMLFFAYSIGRNFMAPLTDVNAGVKSVMHLQTGPSTKNAAKVTSQALMQWTEVTGHPGLIFAMMHQSNNPVVFMLKPDGIIMQEIKYSTSNAKSKVMDMVAIRHTTAGQERTTLLLLYEDGCLRIFAANIEYTNYWLSAEVQPISNQLYQSYQGKSSKRSSRHKNVYSSIKSGTITGNKTSSATAIGSSSSSSGGAAAASATSTPIFPIDFFEHCTHLSDIEFGGNDLLQIYNTQQLKHRLNSTGLYVVSTRTTGFTLEITNNDPNMVLTGVRVLIGTQDITRAPPTVTIHNRIINTASTRPRWYDIPLTRDESLLSDKKLSVHFGPTQDPDNVIMLDSIKVYGKTKDAFGWPEETDDIGAAGTSSNATAVPLSNTGVGALTSGNDCLAQTITPIDKMLTSMLEVLDSALALLGGASVDDVLKQKSMEMATFMLLCPLPKIVQSQAKCVLATLHGNRNAYNSYKDKEILMDVNSELEKMKSIRDIKNIDPEAFFRLVLMTRAVAVARPQTVTKLSLENNFTIVPSFMKLLKDLHAISLNYELQSSIVRIGLSHPEATVFCLVEIIYAFALSDASLIDTMTKYFIQLILDKSPIISHSAKQALMRLLRPKVKRRRVIIGSPPACSTPTPPTLQASSVSDADLSRSAIIAAAAAVATATENLAAAAIQDPNAIEQMDVVGAAGGNGVVGDPENAQAISSVEALLAMGGFDLHQEAEDEAIMEIAIALSLQEHESDLHALQQGLANYSSSIRGQALQSLQALTAQAGGQQGGYNNETGTSAGGSDDEGSNAATEGSTLRTSPADHPGSAGSESGGSGVESIGGISGRSSTYGDQSNQSPPRNELKLKAMPVQELTEEPEDTVETENTNKLHVLRTKILMKMVENIKSLDSCNGHQAIPFMQVILMLTADLDGSQECDQNVMQCMLNALIDRLEIPKSMKSFQMTMRTPKTEVQLVILRLVGVLMGKIKSSSKSNIATSSSTAAAASSIQQQRDNSTFVASATANALRDGNVIQYCLFILKSFLPYWRNAVNNDDLSTGGGSGSNISQPSSTSNTVLKLHNYGPEPDIQPFFGEHFGEKNASNVFEQYSMNITEIVVRIPYQVLKLSTGDPEWFENAYEQMSHTLCEYMMVVQSPTLRRIIRKLLLFICGSKDRYRQSRDIHSLDTHIKMIKKYADTTSTTTVSLTGTSHSTSTAALSYDALVELTEHLRACQDVASARTGNWQQFCLQHTDVLAALVRISTYQLAEGVSPIILQLLQCAICTLNNDKNDAVKQSVVSASAIPVISAAAAVKQRQERDKSEDAESFPDSKFDPILCGTLVGHIFTQVSLNTLTKFIKIFLLETNTTSIRWQAHALVYALYENSSSSQKERLLKSMWDLWPLLPIYGRRTAQFVDLLGYLTLNIKMVNDKLPEYMAMAVAVLRQQNERLTLHPNAPIYTALGQVLELEGFYLESEPCLVCNNPEVAMSNIKLSSIKIDSKFTTTTTIVKLAQSHTISKIVLRIADLKRTKMVRTINIYYNNRTVQAVVELKNRPSMWHKARKVTLQSGQTDVKIEFLLPITACNLMIEYADFYETVTGSSENVQCPRCSAAVPANPGVCSNCGENVFQCHKCRAINYDEKDPFLCHSCGFCKYAKFDYSICGRACCAVDPIESAEDRVKTTQIIHLSLEKADRVYRTLQANKQILEFMVQKVFEHDRAGDDGGNSGASVTTSQVNKVIQLLAQKYCVESKSSFEELSKIIQKVQACRRELVAYDRSQMDLPPTTPSAVAETPTITDNVNSSSISNSSNNIAVIQNRCYGCALASTEQCLTLLRAMASNVNCRIGLCDQGLVDELAQNNLRRGTSQIQEEVRNLLCLLTRNLPDATNELCKLIQTRVTLALSDFVPFANIDAAVRHEMALLESLMSNYDSCWELKLKVVLEIFLLACKDVRGPPVSVLQPCLKILENLISPPMPKSKTNKDATTADLYTIKPVDGLTVDYRAWLRNDPIHSFEAWRSRMPQIRKLSTTDIKLPDEKTLLTDSQIVPVQPILPGSVGGGQQKVPRMFSAVLEQKRLESRRLYLSERYGQRWLHKVLAKGVQHQPIKLTASWLRPILFNTNSRIGRQLASGLVPSIINKNHERKRELINLFTSFLKYIGDVGEASEEFLLTYRRLTEDTPWRQYVVLKGVLFLITDLLSIEIEKIYRLEETTLSSDLAQGYALRQLVELLAMFLDNPKIRQVYKGKLLGPVLQSYLSLRKLVVQRTRLIDDAQEKLLEMLEEMTTGTEEETQAFMSVLIDTVCKTPMNDIKTPVFIFERLCSIIHPEENDVGEFFLTLEKDAQQEDFLQGRMLGNPYPSSEAGLGPLMRDVKNKICMDCELVALLEDDTGMELLVYNKIISLDLPVKEVYKKVWLAEGGERDTMRVVYRMRGLLGDATEEFVETLNNKSAEQVDNEQLYRMANVLADCNGLKVMLNRIAALQNVSRSRSLLQVLLKLFLLAVKVQRCQEVLCQPELEAINTLLKVLQICLQTENDLQQSTVTEQLLDIMETILSKAASDTLDSFLQFSLTFGGPEYVTALISCTNCSNVRNSAPVLRHLIRVLAALVYGNDLKMALLCNHFKDVLDFNKFDMDHNAEDEFRMELFCVLTNQIEHNSIGGTLKDYIMGLGIVDKALAYITTHAPCVKPTLTRTDSDELKEFFSKPSLKYILRFLTGLTTKHEATQLAIAKDIIPIIHRLEQVSSDEHVGSLAENLLEALCTDPATANRVQEVRDFTRTEKKRLAMATREKQLDALGMRTNDKGQVTAKGSILQKIEKLRDETGLTCFICREGYACQPSKVLGIYTFTKRTNIEEFEMKPRKTLAYTTVTHFNVVHIDCHVSAIRLARGRDEWESASLQNANTRCNGLLPLWGPDVLESTFATCMTRHNADMQESSQRCEITFTNAIHDLKFLLQRFAQEKSFHDDAGGGGPQSNMHLVPYLLFYSLYILLSSRSFTREEKCLTTFLSAPPSDRWLESAYEIEGPFYQITLSLALHTYDVWKRNRLQQLKRLIVAGHARAVSPTAVPKCVSIDLQTKDYSVYKPFLMMWAIVDLIYTYLFKTVTAPKEEDWPISLFDYIRRHDEAMLKSTDNILQTFTDEYLPCTSFEEFCDVAGLLTDIENPTEYLENVLLSLVAPVSTT